MKLFNNSARALLLYAVLSLFGLGHVSSALGQSGHTLIAEYTFAQSVYFYAPDASGNNNNINGGSSWGGSGQTQFSSSGIGGGGSLLLDGGENVSDGSPPPDQTFDNLLATFAGSFSISLWVNTTTVVGNDADDPDNSTGATIIWAYNNGFNDTIPIALTGHKVAFFTGDPTGNNSDTLHSKASVTTGNFVHIVVTRDQSTGQKAIYINGVLDSTDTGTTVNLDGNNNFYAIGGVLGSSYSGLLDDVQFYSGVLNSNEVAYLYSHPDTTVSNVVGISSGLAAYYDFDENTALAADLTDHGNNLLFGGNFGGPVISSDAVSGSGAVIFDGASFLTPSANLLPTLAGDFSLSVWVKTTQSSGSDGEPAYSGEGIVSADIPGLTNDLVPVALAGGGIGFNTGGTSDQTLSSATEINDGNYHHIVVTRDQATGEKQIYIDGALSSSGAGSVGLLNAPKLLTLGALANASNPDPTSPSYTGYQGFTGLMDDLQIYSRVLTANEISALHAHPGANATNGLVAHYDFDEGTVQATDVSGHGNNIVATGTFTGTGPSVTSQSESGGGALSFDGNTYSVPQGNLPTILAGDFSLSVWLQTTQSFGSSASAADAGAGIVTADVPGGANDLVPLALTGGNIAFGTGGNSDDTLTSTTAINDGNYHHVVVTRDQASGQKQIYLDGQLNNSDVAYAGLLNAPQMVIFGALADASQSDPSSPASDASNGYVGQMDQVQIYSRVLSSSEVAYLYQNPGATIQPNAGSALGAAVGAPNLSWATSGNAPWFVETSNTYSTNAAAVQSGSLPDDQSSVLQTTVTGPGILSFYWQTSAGGDDFDLEFDVDGNYQDDISGQTSWTSDTFTIGSGPHTLTWNANTLANYGSSPTDAGFLDQVVFTPGAPPVITLNPFNQTNYPGYNVALLANASGTPTPTWQWYEVGNPNPIPGATSALFIPATSGTSAVTGSYYALASNIIGSQATTAAQVTFVNATRPPDWSAAFKSPFVNSDGNGTYPASDVYHACLVDATGTNIYSVGFSSGTNYFGTTRTASAAGQIAAVIVKQTIAKAGLWVVAVTNNGNGSAYGEAIASAPGGGVYVTVGYSGTNWLRNTLLVDSGAGSILLARLDANGNILWTQTMSATNGSFPVLGTLVSDSSGNVTMAGVAGSSITVGGTPLAISGQTSFLAQFNSNGTLNWAERFPNLIECMQSSGGRIYVSLLNWLSGNQSYTVGGLPNTLALNYSLAAINATNGQGIWVRSVGEAFGSDPSSAIDDIPQIAVAGTNVFLTGTAYGSSATFGAFTVPISGGRGQYFASYDTNGNALLATGFGSPTTQPEAAVADAAGNVYVAGNFDTYAIFGNDLLAAPHLGSIATGYFSQGFVAKFNSSGIPQWARLAQSTNQTIANTDLVTLWDVTLGSNTLWVCGEGSGAVYFGTNLVNSAGEYVAVGQNVIIDEFQSGMLGTIPLTEPLSPVMLIDPLESGSSFEFSFVSLVGHTHYVQYTTNLVNPNWLPYSTVPGDGTLKLVTVPSNQHAAAFFRVSTQ